MISVLTVSYKSPEFLELLVRSVRANTKAEHEILVYHNGGDLPSLPDDVRMFMGGQNIGHGKGLDELLKAATGDRLLILDVDAHILLKDWDTAAEKAIEDAKADALVAPGSPLKPIRPAFMYMKAEAATEAKCSFEPMEVKGAKFDVGIMAYFQLLTAGKKVIFTEPIVNPYPKASVGNLHGEAYAINGMAVCYHNWYGTRFNRGQKEELDGRRWEDAKRQQAILFEETSNLWRTEKERPITP